jgi:hypothetical protein
VDRSGELSGYYSSATGAGRFSCIFYVRGKLNADTARITTWFPKDREQIRGELKFVVEDGKPGVNIKLESAHGGCWNVNPEFDEAHGSTLLLDQPGDWLFIRVVSAAKAYFHSAPDAQTKQKAYVVLSDAVRVFKSQPGWIEAEFHGECIDNACARRKIKRGWLKEADLFSSEPPK